MRTKYWISLLLFINLIVVGHITAQENKFNSTIVIDPGHGGKDPGAHFGSLKEKDLVLDIALMAGAFIQKMDQQTKVVYTRSNDTFVALNKRAEIANKSKADLFISIHANYFGSPGVSGAETFVMGIHNNEENLQVAKKENSVILLEEDYTTHYEGFDPSSVESYIMFETIQNEYLTQSILFADTLQDEFKITAKRKNRGVKQAGFLVLKKTTMPSVLIEVGFLSNSNDRAFLNTNTGKSRVAESIANAYINYKKQFISTPAIPAKIAIAKKEPKKEPKAEPQKSKELDSYDSNTIQHINTIKGKVYTIQIEATKEKFTSQNHFKTNESIFYCYETPYYKYFYGNYSNLKEAKKVSKKLAKQFNGCFIVGIKNGKKIKINEF